MYDELKYSVYSIELERYISELTYLIQDGTLLDAHNNVITNVFIEKCSGKKDKNGRLIYEGDIVRYKIGHCGSPNLIIGEYTKVVTFNNSTFDPIFNPEIVEIEVIGNIHQGGING